MKTVCRFAAVILIISLVFAVSVSAFAATYCSMEPFVLKIYTGEQTRYVRAANANYKGNVYISLKDFSHALAGTDKQYCFSHANTAADGEHYRVDLGQAPAGTEFNGEDSRTESVWLEFRRNRLFFNGIDRKYYSLSDGNVDLFMALPDILLMLDISAGFTEDGGLRVLTDVPYRPDIDVLEEAGYFDCLNGAVLGIAETGEVLFHYDRNRAVPIASTSKLMTYLLLREAADRGEISFDDIVTISSSAAALSTGADGIIKMEAGQQVPFRQLIDAMLLASSNESALALAEHCCGNEAAFTQRMNERAAQLGLYTAVFYNPHGLPCYAGGEIPAKLQNRMSAADLFELSSYVVLNCPEITEITSKQYATMPALEYTTANSNPLVFNMPEVNGLKTGSTNRAGYCLCASMPVIKGKETRTVILVILGSETGADRGQQAEILLRFAKQVLSE